MQLYPTIELQNGKPVNLHRGRLDEPQIWHVDPVEKAREFAQAGAEWINVTDFDAITGSEPQDALLTEIIRAAGVPVQVGGGVRSRERIEALLDLGAGRVVVGTSALTNPDMVKEAAKYHPDQVVLALDVFEGQVMSEGWRTTSAFAPGDFLGWFADDPLAAVIITDIDSDIGESEASLALVTDLAGQTPHPVIARGLSRSMDELSRLKYVPGVHGAVIGRSLFDKSVDLREALALAAQPVGEKAEFM